MTSEQLTAQAKRPARNRLTTKAVFVSFVVVVIGTAQFLIGAAGNLIGGPGWQERALGILLLGLGLCGGYAVKGWFQGRPASRWTALAFLPVVALALLWDDQRHGETSGAEWFVIVVPPLAAWLLLFLPDVRRYFSRL